MSRTRKARDEAAELLDLLVDRARAVRLNAYAPYSKYRVGAAVLTEKGELFVGCNFENASYGAAICAERSAIAQMVSAGARAPIACVVVTKGPKPGTPCGICRQVLSEFADDMYIVLVAEGARGVTARRDTTLKALLPDAFRLDRHKR
jgi:cytidine deaminase